MTCRIAGKSSGPDLAGLLRQISKDPAFCSSLLPAGYIQFGKGPDFDYDPVCFGRKTGICRIVKIDHEEILCNHRIKFVAEVAPSFKGLTLQTIDQADRISREMSY
jgi:hypothetical protein